MNAHVLLNSLNELGKGDKIEACQAFYHFFMSSINPKLQEHKCKILSYDIKIILKS